MNFYSWSLADLNATVVFRQAISAPHVLPVVAPAVVAEGSKSVLNHLHNIIKFANKTY